MDPHTLYKTADGKTTRNFAEAANDIQLVGKGAHARWINNNDTMTATTDPLTTIRKFGLNITIDRTQINVPIYRDVDDDKCQMCARTATMVLSCRFGVFRFQACDEHKCCLKPERVMDPLPDVHFDQLQKCVAFVRAQWQLFETNFLFWPPEVHALKYFADTPGSSRNAKRFRATLADVLDCVPTRQLGQACADIPWLQQILQQ